MNKGERLIAIRWAEAQEDYTDYQSQFIDTFNLNDVQQVALSHLCKLAQEYALANKALTDAGISVDEALAIYSQEWEE